MLKKMIVIILIILIIYMIRYLMKLFKTSDKNTKVEKEETKEIEIKNKITPLKVVAGAIDMGTSILRNNHTEKQMNIKEIELKIKELTDDSILKPTEKKRQLEYLHNQLEGIKKEEKKNVVFLEKKEESKKKIEKIEKDIIVQQEKTEKEIVKQEEKKHEQEQELIVAGLEKKDNTNEKNNSTKEANERENVTFETIENKKIIHDPKLDEQKEYIKNSNNELKMIKVEIKVVEEEIAKNITNNRLDLFKYKTEDLKERVNNIKKKYYDFRNSDYYYLLKDDYNLSQIDKFDLLKSDDEINNYLNKCETALRTIETKKHENINPKQEEKKPEINGLAEQIKEEEHQEKVRKTSNMVEIVAASAIIKKDIEKQREQVQKINQKINTLPIQERKTKRFGFFDNILGNTFRIGLSILPFKFFRNRALGFLTSMFMLNNTIRSMRMVVTPELNIDYVEFNRRMKKQADIINGYNTICNDSLYQISSLKNEFVRNYGNLLDDADVKKVYMKIEAIEDQILSQKEKLTNTKTKINAKVKKLERYQNNH